jgi:3-deoxy-D-manno-octulosonic-acid transferase
LLNARHSRTRARLPRSTAALLSCFDLITTQDPGIAEELIALGIPAARVLAAGDLKSDAAPLPDHPGNRATLAAAIAGQPVWSAVSTHPADEAPVLQAQLDILRGSPSAILLWVPRHPDRAEHIAAACRAQGLSVARRSLGELPTHGTSVYLADTIGETGVFFRLSRIVFLGGSFGSEGGHNPFEPLRLGAVVLHGPGVRHFAQAYARLDAEGAARRVTDATTLAEVVAALIGDPDALARATLAGERCLAYMGGARKATLARLLALAGRDA